MEVSINERISSQMYSDVINSYTDINSVTATRNIVPGSYKESVVQCTDQTLATLNSAGGQTLFTRLKLTPAIRNATLAQLAQIYFQYTIPSGSLGLLLHKMVANAKENENTTAGTYALDQADNITAGSIQEHLKFKLFYDTGFSIASMVQLCLVADAKVSTENFNYQQALLTLNSLPDSVTANSTSESTLDALVHNEAYKGVGSGLIDLNFTAHDDVANPSGIVSKPSTYVLPIQMDIGIEGIIDLDRGNPLFHNFPIITRNMGELYLRLYMENFLRELKIVYLNKKRISSKALFDQFTGRIEGQGTSSGANTKQLFTITNNVTTPGTTDNSLTGNIKTGTQEYLPYQRLPADKADFIYLDGDLYKVRLINLKQNTFATNPVKFNQPTNPIFTLDNISWKRFEIRKVEFDIEDFEDIKASQAKAGTYKFPVHLFRSKNFDQTNAASSSANALQTTLNAPNIDRIFITQPWSRDYYTFLPTVAATDMNPQLHNNPVLPRTEDCLNSRTCERIYNVFTDTDKYSAAQDLVSSTEFPCHNKQLWLKGPNTYGGANAFYALQKGIDDTSAGTHIKIPTNIPFLIPNKFAYGLELNEGGCFRKGFNSVVNGNYSPTVPVNLQQSVSTSSNLYFSTYAVNTNAAADGEYETSTLGNNGAWNSIVSYCDLRYSGAVASIHCLCDYIFWMNFDQFGNMVDFGVSEYNGQA